MTDHTPPDDLLAELGATSAVVAAPMAGGPGTPALVAAAADAGAVGFLAAGYKSPEVLAEQLEETRRSTRSYGVNLFAPNPVPVDPAAFRSYAEALRGLADSLGVDLGGAVPVEDDDAWSDKVDLLTSEPAPVVSFTFGLPTPDVVRRLRRAGSLLLQTVTTADEARRAAELGVDGLVVQGPGAGGHSGTLTPARPVRDVALTTLVAEVRAAMPLPVWGAGGLSTARQVRQVLAAGAAAAVVGTVLLRTPESGASAAHRGGLVDPGLTETVLTRAFSGRPARGLRNAFVERFDAIAPLGYPAIHHLTSPLRKAAAAAGDTGAVNLWAGTGFRDATDEPAADILRRLDGAG